MATSPAVCYFIGTRPNDCTSGSVEIPADVRALYLKTGSEKSSQPQNVHQLKLGVTKIFDNMSDSDGDDDSHSEGTPSHLKATNNEQAEELKRVTSASNMTEAFSQLMRPSSGSLLGDSSDRGSSDYPGSEMSSRSSFTDEDADLTLKEGPLLYQRPNSSEWQRKLFVVNMRQIVFFNFRGKAAAGSISTDRISRLFLRASSDYAIELTVDSGETYLLLADSIQANEQWMLAILHAAPIKVREQLVPSSIEVALPTINGTESVPVTLETTAADVIKALRDKMDDTRFDVCSLALRRGDRLIWLSGSDRILSIQVIFQSHVVECRKTSEREQQDRARAATMKLPRPHDVEGYLQKQGAEGPVKAWRKRFFFSNGSYLFYTKTHNTKTGEPASLCVEAIGFINLESANSIEAEINPRSLIFEISVPGRIYRLQAASRDESVLWVVSLRRIREFYRQQTSDRWNKVTPWQSAQTPAAFMPTKREGLLMKRGYFNKAFKERYFILAGGFLCYFDSRESTHQMRGKIPLAGSHVVVLLEEDAPNAFSIVTANRAFVLHTDSQQSMEEWIEAINKEKAATI